MGNRVNHESRLIEARSHLRVLHVQRKLAPPDQHAGFDRIIMKLEDVICKNTLKHAELHIRELECDYNTEPSPEWTTYLQLVSALPRAPHGDSLRNS